MMLNFNGDWRYEPPSQLPEAAVSAVHGLLLRVSPGGSAQPIYECLKRHFALAAQRQVWSSSNVSFARQDLLTEMQAAAENEPLFLEALHDGLVALQARWPDLVLPPWTILNQTLQRFGAAFIVEPPNLLPLKEGLTIAGEPKALSLDAQAREAIKASWREAEALLATGKPRQAVQESMWLLETAVTALRGLPLAETTVQGRYFNRIADEFRARAEGRVMTQVLDWIRPMHGFLSSPSGGGVRHGADVNALKPVLETEARLYCNLARSYVTYFLEEYDRLVAGRE